MATRPQIPLKHLAVAVCLALGLSACGGDSADSAPTLVVDTQGVSTVDGTALQTTLATLPLEGLSADEQASLTYMREEEKLAHDVYTQLDALWGSQTNTLGNIATSEATHTEAVRQLLERYQLADPALGQPVGVFVDATLQTLYNDLLAQGTPSLEAALRVGALVEEVDIVDIRNALVTIDNADIRLVYDNLMKGSRNHLRAFIKALGNLGVVYQPQTLDVETYNAIVSTPVERGG